MSKTQYARLQSGEVKQPSWRKLREILGPGLITGASDDDPSGIATDSQAGAQFGHALMCAIQQVTAQLGQVTGRGIAGNLCLFMPPWLLYGIVFLLLGRNTINLGVYLGAMAAAVKLLIPVRAPLDIIDLGLISILPQTFVRYSRYASVLKWLSLSLFADVGTVFIVGVPGPHAIMQMIWSHIKFTGAYLTVVVVVLGTTISPYLFLWHAGEEVEAGEEIPVAQSLKGASAQAPAELQRIRCDTYLGMELSNIAALAIVITTAATLNAHSQINIATSSQAALALRPIAGHFFCGFSRWHHWHGLAHCACPGRLGGLCARGSSGPDFDDHHVLRRGRMLRPCGIDQTCWAAG